MLPAVVRHGIFGLFIILGISSFTFASNLATPTKDELVRSLSELKGDESEHVIFYLMKFEKFKPAEGLSKDLWEHALEMMVLRNLDKLTEDRFLSSFFQKKLKNIIGSLSRDFLKTHPMILQKIEMILDDKDAMHNGPFKLLPLLSSLKYATPEIVEKIEGVLRYDSSSYYLKMAASEVLASLLCADFELLEQKPDILTQLEKMLNESQDEVRTCALKVMASLIRSNPEIFENNPRYPRQIARMLSDDSPNVRRAALKLLSSLKDVSPKHLLEVLEEIEILSQKENVTGAFALQALTSLISSNPELFKVRNDLPKKLEDLFHKYENIQVVQADPFIQSFVALDLRESSLQVMASLACTNPQLFTNFDFIKQLQTIQHDQGRLGRSAWEVLAALDFSLGIQENNPNLPIFFVRALGTSPSYIQAVALKALNKATNQNLIPNILKEIDKLLTDKDRWQFQIIAFNALATLIDNSPQLLKTYPILLKKIVMQEKNYADIINAADAALVKIIPVVSLDNIQELSANPDVAEVLERKIGRDVDSDTLRVQVDLLFALKPKDLKSRLELIKRLDSQRKHYWFIE